MTFGRHQTIECLYTVCLKIPSILQQVNLLLSYLTFIINFVSTTEYLWAIMWVVFLIFEL